MYPEVKEKIEEIIVFQAGVKINMLGLDVTEKALLHRENILKMRDSGKTGNMLYHDLSQEGETYEQAAYSRFF